MHFSTRHVCNHNWSMSVKKKPTVLGLIIMLLHQISKGFLWWIHDVPTIASIVYSIHATATATATVGTTVVPRISTTITSCIHPITTKHSRCLRNELNIKLRLPKVCLVVVAGFLKPWFVASVALAPMIILLLPETRNSHVLISLQRN